jgi:transcription initiation factor TFIIF subunit beta
MEKPTEANDLNLKYAQRGVWLVKVPKYMSECWQKANPGDEVGKVVITTTKTLGVQDAKSVNNVSFHINEQLAQNYSAVESTTIPTEHSFVMKKEGRAQLPQSLFVLSSEPIPETANTSQHAKVAEYATAIEGRVIDRAECRPTGDAGYMQLKKGRMEASIKPQREVVQLTKPVNNYKPISVHDSQLEYEAKKKEEGKKIRLEKEQVHNLLFAAFEKHQYYNVKDLVRVTNQPITFLKEILKELCTYNMKAPHKNMWELKPEYRFYKDGGPKDAAS